MSRIIGLFACILGISLALACSIEPSDQRPGLGLSGEAAQQPVQDWSFASDAKEIFIETATPYFIPHSVTIWSVTLGNQLYVAAYHADTKRWVTNVARDPNVRLKIGNKIYEQKLETVKDAATLALLNGGYVRKYELEEDNDVGKEASSVYWRVVERD